MANFNQAMLIGNLTRDPEIRDVGDTTVCNFSLAVNTKMKSKEEILFIDITAWGKLGENVAEFMQKGSPVMVIGRLKLESWVDNNGNKRSKHAIHANDVKFLDRKKSEEDQVLTSRSI